MQVLWDSGTSVSAYCRKMSTGGVWGGGIEMAAVSHLKRVNVFVYQQSGGNFKRISSFESPTAGTGAKPRTVRVLCARQAERGRTSAAALAAVPSRHGHPHAPSTLPT